jgi:hypothetical protein
MTISDPALVTTLVFLIAGLFLLQTLFLLVFVDQVNRRVRRAERSLNRVSRRATAGFGTAKNYLQQLGVIAEKIPAVANEVDSLLDITVEKVHSANQRAAREIHLTTAHIEETGRRIEFALSQFTRQTSKVRRWIRYPGHCLSAIIHGAFAGVKTYSRDSSRGQPATHYPDEEIFI